MINESILASKQSLINTISSALTHNEGLAVGKLGFSEQLMLLFHLSCNKSIDPLNDPKLRPVYVALKYACERQTGVFPTDFEFLIRYSKFFAENICNADFLGLFGSPNEATLISNLDLNSQLLKYVDTEPDRSTPYNKSLCYLELFSGKKILLIAPFASFAMKRANKDTFESVWEKINCPWFYPREIMSLDIPYSYVGQIETHNTYKNSISLYENLIKEIDSFDFDVALIAAGSLAIPIAVHIKSRQRIAISLGGHFQVLFGILGDRWTRNPSWMMKYINEKWVRLPSNLIPANADALSDNKAYW